MISIRWKSESLTLGASFMRSSLGGLYDHFNAAQRQYGTVERDCLIKSLTLLSCAQELPRHPAGEGSFLRDGLDEFLYSASE